MKQPKRTPIYDKELLLAYFDGKCPSEQENDIRLYLKTPSGQQAASELMDKDIASVLNGEAGNAAPMPPAGLREKILREIGLRIRRRQRIRTLSRIAAVALPLVFLNLLLLGRLYDWGGEQIAYQKIYVPAGEQLRMLMADGTSVMLNSETTLEYPARFDRRNRHVRLQGEAYFEVAKDPARPFRVEAGGMTVRVLGTKFNLNTSAPESTQLYLQEGRVSIEEHLSGKRRSYDIAPGQLFEMDRVSGRCTLLPNADTAAVVGWMHKRFYFKNTPLKDLLGFLEHNYGVECRVTDSRLYKYTYTINFNNESVDQILSAMERITPMRIVRVADSITIHPLDR
ncbi:FecR domain-containing protein [Alistipes sp. D31t1_170403_E11]|uniref:FecR family protein n=1 Tax=Alistipes sp. D31t1_170403_E11 TaxID=2787128 RepID=UPI00189AA468|nr:FecR domain-containing protein [Alistipes sp. D31t1_170403_E11]